MLGFGDDLVQTLLEQFDSYMSNPDLVKAEWPLLRASIFELYVHYLS